MKALLLVMLATSVPAFAAPAPLRLEGNFHFTVGYKDDSCARKITIKAVRDPETDAVLELDIYDVNRPEADGKPTFALYNRGTRSDYNSKTIETVTDTDADNVRYRYELGIRSKYYHVHFQIKDTWFDGEELRSFNGQDLCNYARD